MEERVAQPTAGGDAEPGQGPGRQASTPLVVGGYLLAVILPPVGLILGIVLLTRRRGHGVAVIAIALSVIVIYLVSASQSSDDDRLQLPQRALREADEVVDCMTKAPGRLDINAQLRLCERQQRTHRLPGR